MEKKENKENQNTSLSALVIGKIHITKMDVLTKVIYFDVIPIKIPVTLFTELETTILKFIGKDKRPQTVKVILAERSVLGYHDA